MKKIFYIFVCLLIISSMIGLPLACFAADEPIEKTTDAEDPALDNTENDAPAEPSATIFDRIYEFVTENKTDLISFGGTLGVIIFGIVSKKGSSSNALSIKSMVSQVQGETERSNDTQLAMVQGLNQMIDGYNNIKDVCTKMFERYEELFNAVSEILKSNVELSDNLKRFNDELATGLFSRNNELKTLLEKELAQNTSIIEILSSVYVNSKLPQGVKDLVQLKHSQNLKLVADEPKTSLKPNDTASEGTD